MVQIQNNDAITAIRDGARLSISEGYPQDLGKTVVPVMDMTPEFHRFDFPISANPVTTGAVTVLTTLDRRQYYLTGVSMSLVKNATCDIATGQVGLTVVIEGVTTTVCAIAVLTLTAEAREKTVIFKDPIKLDNASIISLTGTFTAGAMSRQVTIYGYETLMP